MKRYIFLFICVLHISVASAQSFYTEIDSLIIPSIRLPYEPLKANVSFSNSKINVRNRRLEFRAIEHPGVRYALQNLKYTEFDDPKIKDAVNTLLQYAGNEQLKHVLNYLTRYVNRNMSKQEQALNTLQEYITLDSTEFYKKQKYFFLQDDEEYLNTDLQTFVQHIRNDSNYIWLRNASRDSVFMEISNLSDNAIKFWTNNGKTSTYRFWMNNKYGDTIGTWIQTIPGGNRLKIYVDHDVYQNFRVERDELRRGPTILSNKLQNYDISSMEIDQVKEKYWTYYAEADFSMSQGMLANWASGGENSLSLLSNFRYFWNYNHNKTSWENWIHYRLGFMKSGSEDIRKNNDRLELNMKLGQKAFKHWYYTAQFNVLTQLFNSYEYPTNEKSKLVANLLSPGYFTLSLGMDYKPNSNFSLVISPIAGKWTYVRDTAKIDIKRYGIEEGKKSKRNAGAELTMNSTFNDIFKVMKVSNRMNLFMSYEKKDKYLNFEKENEKKKRLPFTFNWQMTISFYINYFMTASIYTETIYDENYSQKLQFKENLSLGVKFRF